MVFEATLFYIYQLGCFASEFSEQITDEGNEARDATLSSRSKTCEIDL